MNKAKCIVVGTSLVVLMGMAKQVSAQPNSPQEPKFTRPVQEKTTVVSSERSRSIIEQTGHALLFLAAAGLLSLRRR